MTAMIIGVEILHGRGLQRHKATVIRLHDASLADDKRGDTANGVSTPWLHRVLILYEPG